MFRKTHITFTTALLSFALLMLYLSIQFPLLDLEKPTSCEYQKNKETSQSIPIQLRKNAKKDCYLDTSKGRIHYHIEAPDSIIQFTNDPKIWTQEEKYDPQGQREEVRLIEAKYGEFNFNRLKFEARDASISAYRLKENEFPMNNDETERFLRGKSTSLEISFDHSTPIFQAKEFSLNFNNPGGL